MTCFIAAEAGTCHRGSLSRAADLTEAALAAGADAVKFQCWTRPFWQPDDPNAALFESCLVPERWWRAIFDYGNSKGIEVFSSVFDIPALEMLLGLGMHRIKLASRSWQDTALIDAAVATGLPVYISTGMGKPVITDGAGRSYYCNTPDNVTWVRCVSKYPCPDNEVRLTPHIRGYSSHCAGPPVDCLAAAALGAQYVERHLKIADAGHPDDCCASGPEMFKWMVGAIRRIEVML